MQPPAPTDDVTPRRGPRRRLLWLLPLPPLVFVLALYLKGNGPTRAGLALSTLPALSLLAAFAPRKGLGARACVAAFASLLLADAAFVASRVSRASVARPSRGAVRYCEQGDCSARPPWLSLVPPEGETSLAGLELSSAMHAIGGDEERDLRDLLRRDYALMDGPRYQGLPNAPVLGVLPGGNRRALVWVPEGASRAPCVVFLHGFGGQLSIYLRALVEGGLGRDHVIVAPFDGPVGMWRGEATEQALTALLDHDLPPEADPKRVVLLGLSNGAVGAVWLGTRGPVGRRLAGLVALSGAGWAGQSPPRATPTLVLTGKDDPRFHPETVQMLVDDLRAREVPVTLELVPGDHFLILRDPALVAERVRSFEAGLLRVEGRGGSPRMGGAYGKVRHAAMPPGLLPSGSDGGQEGSPPPLPSGSGEVRIVKPPRYCREEAVRCGS